MNKTLLESGSKVVLDQFEKGAKTVIDYIPETAGKEVVSTLTAATFTFYRAQLNALCAFADSVSKVSKTA